MQSNVSCDAILDPRGMKFLQIGKLGAGFCLSQKRFSSVKICKFKKIFLIMTPSSRHELLYDTHPGEVIKRGKFDVCTSSSFGEVEVLVPAYTRTDRIELSTFDEYFLSASDVTCSKRQHNSNIKAIVHTTRKKVKLKWR